MPSSRGVEVMAAVGHAYVPDNEEILALASSYRHGLLNHVQVVLGWMKLGQESRAEEYIALLKETLDGESRLARSVAPDMASLLLTKRGVAEILGLEVRFRVADGVRGVAWDSPATARYAAAVVDGAVRLLHRSGAGSRITIALGEVGGRWRMDICLAGLAIVGEWEPALAAAAAAAGRDFDFAVARAELEARGGYAGCREHHGPQGYETVISLLWPRCGEMAGSPEAGEETPCSSTPHASL